MPANDPHGEQLEADGSASRVMDERELDMSFNAAWGFDPDKATQANGLTPSETEIDRSAYSVEEQRAARIPSDMHSQIYELRRMYRM